MVLEFVGSIARAPTFRTGKRSVRGFHVWPPSVVFQTPPVTAPAYTTSGLVEIGRASCRERVEISVVAVSLKKKGLSISPDRRLSLGQVVGVRGSERPHRNK